ncbi:S8 family peptidase [Actinoplanes sp. NPDC051851]|uniref:S8 family peptidase n=1 Tax=Actinoplanes sp. NPDC051851 TaxID=3154753 RepID=UPI00341D055D
MRLPGRRRYFAGPLAVAAIAGLGALVVPAGTTVAWTPVSYGLTASAEQMVPATVSAAKPARVVTTTLDRDRRPVISVREATDRASALRLIAEGRRAENVVGVAIDTRVRALGVPSGTDPYRSQQWDFSTLHVADAWKVSTGADVTVAVIDTGVDATHPDLEGQVLTGYDEIDDVAGGNTDPNGHGTHVAGTIAALTGNGTGVSAIAPGVEILPVRVLDATGGGDTSATAAGVIWAADHGADVINMSIGGTEQDTTLDNAITYARSKGVVVVAAAGNERAEGSPTEYPGASPGVIAVAATDWSDTVASYSNQGDYVDVAAPGSGIISTYPPALGKGSYVTMNGTSMATPHVAAVAALLKAYDPDLTPDEVETALESSAVDLGTAGRDDDYGYGRIDAAAALATVAPAVRPTVTPSVTTKQVGYGTRTRTTFTVAGNGSRWAGEPVSVCVSVAGGSWSCTSGTAGTTGTYTLARTATASFRARLTVAATSTSTAASATVSYTVKAGVKLARTAKRTLTVTVTGATGQTATVQRRTGGTWRTVSTFKAVSSKKLTGLVSGGSYRVVLASTARIQGVTSATVKA